MKSDDKPAALLLIIFFLVVVSCVGWLAWTQHQEANRELATAHALAGSDNVAHSVKESFVREAFQAWERTTKENGELLVWRGDTAQVLWVAYHPAWVNVDWGRGFRVKAQWEVVAQTPAGRLFYASFDPYNHVFVDFSPVDREWVIREAIKAGRKVDESTFLRAHGKDA